MIDGTHDSAYRSGGSQGMTNSPVRSTMTAKFSYVVWKELRPWYELVDLGAGDDGSIRSPLSCYAERVRRVEAVDLVPCPQELPGNVDWRSTRIEDWERDRASGPPARTHALIARNSLHFLDRDFVLRALLPTIARDLAAGGVLAIATLARAPDPPSDPPYRSFFRLDDLCRSLPKDWQTLLGVEESLRGSGYRDDTVRVWHTTQLVIRRPR